MTFLPDAKLHYFFGRDQDLADLVGEAEGLGAAAQRVRHFLFETRVGVDDEPVLGRILGRACVRRGSAGFGFRSFGSDSGALFCVATRAWLPVSSRVHLC